MISPRLFLVFTSCLLVLTIFALLWDKVCISISGAPPELNEINGYYMGMNGWYLRIGHPLEALPDVFGLIDLHHKGGTDAGVLLLPSGWGIFMRGEPVYAYTQSLSGYVHINNPPSTGWVITNAGKQIYNKIEETSVIVSNQWGNLADAPTTIDYYNDNLRILFFGQPVTTFIIACLFGIAYYLYMNQIPVDVVSFSYDKVLQQGEYGRIVTASLAHFDLWHLGFNTMAAYQMGILESVYGSVKFLYLSISLIFITIIICVGIYHVMIYRFEREDMRIQQGVGYSCVLFAWIVAASVNMDEFCPIFFLPKMCFKTFTVPLVGFPINLGALVLLVVTKFIIPRSSFIGHLAGVIIGYPLAWRMLDFLTPPVLLVLLTTTFVHVQNLIPSRSSVGTATSAVVASAPPSRPDAESGESLDSPNPSSNNGHSLVIFQYLRYSSYSCAFVASCAYFVLSWPQTLLVIGLTAICWGASEVSCIDSTTILGEREVKESCARLTITGLFYALFCGTYFLANISATIATWHLLVACLSNGGVTFPFLVQFIAFSASIGASVIILVSAHRMPKANAILERWGLDARSLAGVFAVPNMDFSSSSLLSSFTSPSNISLANVHAWARGIIGNPAEQEYATPEAAAASLEMAGESESPDTEHGDSQIPNMNEVSDDAPQWSRSQGKTLGPASDVLSPIQDPKAAAAAAAVARLESINNKGKK